MLRNGFGNDSLEIDLMQYISEKPETKL